VIFSDSIVVTTDSDSQEALQRIIEAVGEISSKLLCDLEVPVRGCITKGHFSRLVSDNGDMMIAGPAVIDAYRWEQDQNWIGSMLSPSVLRHDNNLRTRCELLQSAEEVTNFTDRWPWPFLLHRNWTIPFHCGDPLNEQRYDGWVIVPRPQEATPGSGLQKAWGTYTEKLEELKALAPTVEAQRKYQKTLNWLGELQRDWDRNIFDTSKWTKRDTS